MDRVGRVVRGIGNILRHVALGGVIGNRFAFYM
jgi:hypothetical protein